MKEIKEVPEGMLATTAREFLRAKKNHLRAERGLEKARSAAQSADHALLNAAKYLIQGFHALGLEAVRVGDVVLAADAGVLYGVRVIDCQRVVKDGAK